jgi:hypothetical protein
MTIWSRGARVVVSRAALVTRVARWGRVLSVAVPLCLPACFLSRVLLPDTRTPVDHAREVAPRCASFSEDVIRSLLARSAVESVEPAYAYISSGSAEREARLRGARIHLRPGPAMSRESLQRSLECHQARVVLGAASARAEDPYVLPGVWLDIDAGSEGDGFVVAVQTNALPDARGVLARARRFAALLQ